MVSPGGTCGSACVLVFLAGQRRWGALTSSWLLHEVGRWTDPARTNLTTDWEKPEREFQDYFLPAGVSETWLRQSRPLTPMRSASSCSRAPLRRSRSRLMAPAPFITLADSAAS